MRADYEHTASSTMPPQTRVLVVYTAESGRGSEPGVGWGFVLVSARKCRDTGQTLTVVLRSDDRPKCEVAIAEEGLGPWVRFVDVSPPKGGLASLANDRVGYFMWRSRAQKRIAALARDTDILSIHQANWGTALLPHVIPRSLMARAIWGP